MSKNKHTRPVSDEPLWWHKQPRRGHNSTAKCCAGCAGALAQRKKNGVKPKRNRWFSPLSVTAAT